MRASGILAAMVLSLSLSGCVIDMGSASEEARVESSLVQLIGGVDKVASVDAHAQFSPTAKGVTVTVKADTADHDGVREILRDVLPAAVEATSSMKYGTMVVTVMAAGDSTIYADASDLGLQSTSLSAYREEYDPGARTGS